MTNRTIRPAEPRDHADFARFFAHLKINDPTPEPARWEAEMMPHTFFVEEDGRTVAYAYIEVFGDLGYVRHVAVDEEARGRGLGRALMDEIAARFRARDCKRWELNVKRDNVPAIALYEAFGMSTKYATTVVRIDWSAVETLPRDDDGTRARSVRVEDDARIERELRLPDGKIARFRSMSGQVLLQLEGASGETRGFARFDPNFPGAFPFRVAKPAYLRALLDAMHAHKSPELEWVQVVLEDDAASAKTLLNAGARLVWEILHMSGTLPRA